MAIRLIYNRYNAKPGKCASCQPEVVVSRASNYLGAVTWIPKSRMTSSWRRYLVSGAGCRTDARREVSSTWARGPYIRYGKPAARVCCRLYRQQSRFPSWSCAIVWVPSPLIRCNDINLLHRCRCQCKLEMFSFCAWPPARWYRWNPQKFSTYVFETLSS